MFNPVFTYVATALNITMLFPQGIAAQKSKETKDLSMTTLVIFLTACLLWILYGIAKAPFPIIFANMTLGALNGFLIYLKIRYKTK